MNTLADRKEHPGKIKNNGASRAQYNALQRILDRGKLKPEDINGRHLLNEMISAEKPEARHKLLISLFTDDTVWHPVRQAARDKVCKITRESDPARDAVW